jgi:hypothetical protein
VEVETLTARRRRVVASQSAHLSASRRTGCRTLQASMLRCARMSMIQEDAQAIGSKGQEPARDLQQPGLCQRTGPLMLTDEIKRACIAT